MKPTINRRVKGAAFEREIATALRCEGLALDPEDVCDKMPGWCIEDSPWLSPIGWEGAGGDCGGAA